MPLKHRAGDGFVTRNRDAILFQMVDVKSDRLVEVRVDTGVTTHMGRSPDLLETFLSNRTMLEQIASRKFDLRPEEAAVRIDLEDVSGEDQRVLMATLA